MYTVILFHGFQLKAENPLFDVLSEVKTSQSLVTACPLFTVIPALKFV